jgi:hypothetical protein
MSSNPGRFTSTERKIRRVLGHGYSPKAEIARRSRTQRRECRAALAADIAVWSKWYTAQNTWSTLRKLERWYRYR